MYIAILDIKNQTSRCSGEYGIKPFYHFRAPSQMTDEWIAFVEGNIRPQNPALANAIQLARESDKLTKTVTGVKRGNNIPGDELGEIVTVKVR